jgi:hypothetical protein
MKTEDLQQYIIILLAAYFLFNIFYKCECTKKTLEGMMPNIDIDVDIGDIVSRGGGGGGDGDGDGGGSDDDPDYSGDKNKKGMKFLENIKDFVIRMMTNVQFLVGMGSVIALIVIGVYFVRKGRTAKAGIEGIREKTSTEAGKKAFVDGMKNTLKNSVKTKGSSLKESLLNVGKSGQSAPPNAV